MKDGGPAFPITKGQLKDELEGYGQMTGMTLRDYFAAAALKGMYANHTIIDTFGQSEVMANEAYRIADAMLEERKTSKKEIP